MALTSLSIDEITSLICDAVDALWSPKKIFRNNNSKLFLTYRANSAGFQVINDAALALHSKFDPENCVSEDLYSTAALVGTAFKAGSGSLLQITVTNTDGALTKNLLAGVYNYTSVSGEVFAFELDLDLAFTSGQSRMISAVTQDMGKFHVGDIASISVVRADLATIDPSFTFSCSDNTGTLGYPDETEFEFRTRILNDTNRQDAIAEIELEIRNLPNILECNLVFNQSPSDEVYDGVTLTPYQLLVIITGAPTAAVAEAIARRTFYHTKQVDPDQVVYFEDPHLLGGNYPVYYAIHAHSNYTVHVDYRYDSTKIIQSNAEAAMAAALAVLTNTSQHVDTITENTPYQILIALALSSVQILNVDLLVGGVPQPFIDFPKTKLPNMSAVTFTGTNISA